MKNIFQQPLFFPVHLQWSVTCHSSHPWRHMVGIRDDCCSMLILALHILVWHTRLLNDIYFDKKSYMCLSFSGFFFFFKHINHFPKYNRETEFLFGKRFSHYSRMRLILCVRQMEKAGRVSPKQLNGWLFCKGNMISSDLCSLEYLINQ